MQKEMLYHLNFMKIYSQALKLITLITISNPRLLVPQSIFQHPEEAVTIAPFRLESHCASQENIHLLSMRGGKPEPMVQAEFKDKEYISIFEEVKDWFEALISADFPEKL